MKVAPLHLAFLFIIACIDIVGAAMDCSQQNSARKSAKKNLKKKERAYEKCRSNNSEIITCSFKLTQLDDAREKMQLMVNVLKKCNKSKNTCNLSPKRGRCKAKFDRWFFNSTAASCETFVYGGCEGNRNNFKTSWRCGNACVCDLPAEPGNCEGYFLSWFFNSETRKCETFQYGGCPESANANRFKSEGDCKNACPVCELPKSPGPCKATYDRWFYNSKSKSCEQFIYGGCEGNRNNFVMSDECQNMCAPIP